ncbi:MAG: hypothetical protein A6F71_02465 [Cycloclasticus sp. symbiont of Poecilosclerida sp. M]|nr:MAG: hypothetical protein A6F71_02465 [Cycloclasticus sp. symbiont of Poecilosclerida sp. M]
MIFSDNETTDYFEIMALIDSFAEANSAKISLNNDKLFYAIKRIYADFPCIDGAQNANVFKKSAAFTCEFIGEQIVESFECEMSDKLKKIPNNGNQILAFHIVSTMLCGATVQDGNKIIENSIHLSSHSYVDIIDALTGITAQGSFKLVTVLFEQLVYKTNPDLQYDVVEL